MTTSAAILTPPRTVAGAKGLVHIAYKDFPCVVLAVIADHALVEYNHGTGSTALAFVKADDPGRVWQPVDMRPCTYRLLLKPWLIAVVQQSGAWVGRSKSGQWIETPQKLLAKRFVMREGIGA